VTGVQTCALPISRRHESVAVPVILFLLAGFVVFGRFSHWS
jgi:hypothetical protein